jgi:hypothetical protein
MPRFVVRLIEPLSHHVRKHGSPRRATNVREKGVLLAAQCSQCSYPVVMARLWRQWFRQFLGMETCPSA